MNMRFFHALFACAFIVLAGGSHAATTDSQQSRTPQADAAAHAGIRAALNAYIQGHATGDPSHFRKAFLPTAHVEVIRDGKFTSWPLDEYCSFFKGSPASDESTRVRTIDFIDESGNTGVAKLTLHHGALVFTDYFLLLKVGDEWKIANKVAYNRRKDS